MPEFAGKIAIVTGGSLGIGRAVAESLGAAGASVVLCGLDEDSVQRAASELSAAGIAVEGVVADVTDGDAMQGLAERARSRFGGVDVLVCSAGIQTYGTVVDTTEEVWDRTIDVNLKGMYLAAKHAIPAMIERGGGAIVNVSSVQALACQPNVAAYAASKAAILGLTRATALDFAGQGIRVNAVCPGSVDTPMLRASADRFRPGGGDALIAEWGRAHPVGHVASTQEVAEVVAFLSSTRARFITGAHVNVDGGLLAGVAVNLPE